VSNVHSTPDQAESDRIWARVEGLSGFGRLYRYDTTVGGIKQRRIRLGFFATREEAEAASARLASEAKLTGAPWLVRPTMAEYNKYYGQSLSDRWAVNISSTPIEADSEKVWAALAGDKAKKYLDKIAQADQSAPTVYRSEATVNDQTHYRIRLGFFATQAEAESAGQGLAAAAGLTASQIGQPWAVRPTVDEEKASGQR
jgi:septal ring-binding cell division protein DamX